MSEVREPEGRDPLREVLRSWTVKEPLPPRFQELVWQRIERAEAQHPRGLFAGLRRLVDVVLPQPKFALLYIMLLSGLGLAAGGLTARLQTNRLQADLSARYVHSIAPYQGHAPLP